MAEQITKEDNQMATQRHIVLKVCGDVDVDFALVPVTERLVKSVIERVGKLHSLDCGKLVQAEFWSGEPVFFETPDDPSLEELLERVESSDYEVVPERPDIDWRLFMRTDCIRMAIGRDGKGWEVYWKAYRGPAVFDTTSVPVATMAALVNRYLKPGAKPYAALVDGTPLYPAYYPLRCNERFRRQMGFWNGATGERVGVTLDGQLYQQSQLWGGEGPRPDRWQKFKLGGV